METRTTEQRVARAPRQPSNGVPWLVWIGRNLWECCACGCSGTLPEMTNVTNFAGSLGDLKRTHVACRPPEDYIVPPGVGDPLNLNRYSRQ